MVKIRGFEVVKGFESKGIQLPIKMTHKSAGYDIEAGEDIVIQPIWKNIYRLFKKMLKKNYKYFPNARFLGEDGVHMAPVRVSTGIKAYMQDDEVLKIYNRSSNPYKRFLFLANGVAVIDADYYNNDDNDGHIFIQFINFGFKAAHIKKGERIAQGVFEKFLSADTHTSRVKNQDRIGGEGSTNK